MAEKMNDLDELDFTVTYNERINFTASGHEYSSKDKLVLFGILKTIKKWWKCANNDNYFFNTSSQIDDYSDMDKWPKIAFDESVKHNKLFWIFQGVNLENYVERIKFFIIDKHDMSMNAIDYVIPLYIMIQEDLDTRKTLENLPVSMLHDILVPIAESNFKSWVKV
jgi:hypothetical protein